MASAVAGMGCKHRR